MNAPNFILITINLMYLYKNVMLLNIADVHHAFNCKNIMTYCHPMYYVLFFLFIQFFLHEQLQCLNNLIPINA